MSLDWPLGIQEFEALRISRQLVHEGGKVVRLKHRPRLPPRRNFWYLFVLEAESTPGPYCGRKGFTVCSAVPQPTAPTCIPLSFKWRS